MPGFRMLAVHESALGKTRTHLGGPRLGCHLPVSDGSPLLAFSFSSSKRNLVLQEQ